MYNKIYNTNILEFNPKKKYDLILLCDILEHLKKPDAKTTIKKLSKYAKELVITTPRRFNQGEPYNGNPYEVHLSRLTKRFFSEFAPRVFLKIEGMNFVITEPII